MTSSKKTNTNWFMSFLLGSSYFQGQTVKPQECCGGVFGVFEIVCLGGLGVRMISLELLLAKGTFQISGGSGGVGCMVGLNTSVDGLKLQGFWDFVFTYEIRIGELIFFTTILAGIHFWRGEWGMPLMVILPRVSKKNNLPPVFLFRDFQNATWEFWGVFFFPAEIYSPEN